MALSPLLSIATHIAIPSSAMASSILCKPFSFTVRHYTLLHPTSTSVPVHRHEYEYEYEQYPAHLHDGS